MIRTRQLIFIFIPALLVAGFGLFIKILQYEPQFPKELTVKNSNLAGIPISTDDPIYGNKKAPNTIVTFGDYSCEACNEQDALLKNLLKKYPTKLKVIWKGVPINHFPYDTTIAHAYAYCARLQGKFDTFKEYAFLNADHLTVDTIKGIADTIKLDNKKLTQCLDSGKADTYVQNAQSLAETLNIQSLPAIFVNNTQIPAPASLEAWETALNL